MLLKIKNNPRRLLRFLAGLLLGCLPMFLSGCFTMCTIRDSRPVTIDRSYKVDAVESAEQLPNGDIVLSVKGRLAANEAEKSSSFALLLSAKEIQAAKERDSGRQKSSPGGYTRIPATRCEMPATEGGAPFLVMLDPTPEQFKEAKHAVVVRDRSPRGNVGFQDRAGIVYVEQGYDGSVYWNGSVFRGLIETDAKDIQKSRRRKLWWLPVTVVADVVTLPLQVIGVGFMIVAGVH